MNDNYLTAKEFAEAAGVSVQTIYKQMNSRLAPFVVTIRGQKKIDSVALQEFYSDDQPKTTVTTENQPVTTEKSTHNQPESTLGNQSKSTQTDLEKRIEELENLLHKQVEEDRQEREFLKDQIRQKDRTIESLTENLKIAQQLAAADKKKLLEIEQRQQPPQEQEPVETDPAEKVIEPAAAAADQEQGQGNNQQKEEQQERGVKAFFRRLFK